MTGRGVFPVVNAHGPGYNLYSSVRFERTERFRRAYLKLDGQQRQAVKEALRQMSTDINPPSLRVKKVQGTRDIWEAGASAGLRLTFTWAGDLIILRNCGEHDKTLKRR